jgi:sulfhydrogenase subunit alpha
MNNKRSINIKVPVLTRVEGEGALEIDINNGEIDHLALRIFEPPRYFEKLLEDRPYTDVPDIVARICGICPVAYQMSAVQALESLFELSPSPWTIDMRRLLYCGEWIQSHSLHIHLLAAPDFLGYDNVLEMSKDHPEIVQRGINLQNLGNEIISFLGGRSVHPVGACTGGFFKSPSLAKARELLTKLEQHLDDCSKLIEWTCSLNLPDNEQNFTSVALHNSTEYPMYHGRLVSSQGLNIDISEFENHFKEHQVAHSTALHALHNNKPYFVGPLARLNLNQSLIPESSLEMLNKSGMQLPSKNIFHSIIARAIELHIAVTEAINILKIYRTTKTPNEMVVTKAGTGYGCTEAPRGFLWHKYQTDENGLITSANIVPPTSQNQAQIESDLKYSILKYGLDHTDKDIRKFSEQIIRNYDPCISCATHFLKLKINHQ